MNRYALMLSAALTAIALAACSPAPPATPTLAAEVTPTPEADAKPKTLEALNQAHDWQYEPGEALNVAFDTGVKAVIGTMSRSDAIGAIRAAGFECIYGEGHEDYPDPAAQCTRSFATRSCQMDWEIFSTAAKGMVDTVDAEFKRDCVGTADDWPEPIKSAIDDQLAPLTPPAAAPAAPSPPH